MAGLLGALDVRDDVAVTVLAAKDGSERWRECAPGSAVRDIVPRSAPVRLVWERVALARHLQGLSPDVHHGTHYTLPRGGAIPNVVTIHDLTFVEHPEWHSRAKALFFTKAIKVAAKTARALVCVSQTTADKLSELYPPAGMVVVAPHGVDRSRFRPEADTESPDVTVLRKLGVAVPYVLYVGTVEPRKDVPTLVRAFDRLSDRHPTLSLVIAGGGWPRAEAELSSAISSTRHPGRVQRLGFVDDPDVPALLRQASAVVYPSLEEGFGLPALEALACGAATITTKGSAMEEFAAESALMFEPGDDATLAELIHQLVIGDPTFEARKSRGLATATSYTWERSAELHMNAYRAAAG